MKQVISILLLMLTTSWAHGQYNYVRPMCYASATAKDDVRPWPWGSEIPFPWRGIEGTWVAEAGECFRFYAFEILKNEADGERILNVRHFDPNTCHTYSTGIGYQQGKIVKAVMNGDEGAYELKVHVFKEADVKAREAKEKGNCTASTVQPLASKNVTVMTTNPMGKPRKRLSYRLLKYDDNPYALCY